jgi:hypothetical protein
MDTDWMEVSAMLQRDVVRNMVHVVCAVCLFYIIVFVIYTTYT